MTALRLILAAALGYLLGNFSTGLIVGKALAKTDIRTRGSGNAGMTNVLRTFGWLPALLTFVGDVLKGFIGAWLGGLIGGAWGMYLGGAFAVVGHNWPALFGFKGGKGMSASLGAILFVSPAHGLLLVAAQLIVLLATRYMSVASLASCVVYALAALITRWGDWGYIGFALALSAMGVFCHRSNIARLRAGNENRLDFSKIKKINKG